MLGKRSVTELNLWPAVSLLNLWILGSKRLYLLSNLTGSLLGKGVLCVRERESEKEREGEGVKVGKGEERKRERERETLLLKVYSP